MTKGAMQIVTSAFALLVSFALLAPSAAGEASTRWWSDAVESALDRAGANRPELEGAIERAPEAWRAALAFLVEHMPPPDLKEVKGEFLLEDVDLALRARARAPWGASLPEEIFLNEVLPYAVLNERRDGWRRRFFEELPPLVEGAKRPAEAAQLLNRRVFSLYKARFSTERKRADQSPFETIESGLASCTGLSILLVDACRAVGVPARAAGTPLWANGRGNHTWVEVWDEGWHFAGAAEPDPAGLDRGWFGHDASQAVADSPQHAIYASSYQKTGLSFPLVWARRVDWVNAVNVTERYQKPRERKPRTRLLVRVIDSETKKRIAAPIEVLDRGEAGQVLRGESRGETADPNDLLAFEVAAGRSYEVRVRRGGRAQSREVRLETPGEQTVSFVLGPAIAAAARALDPEKERALRDAVRRHLSASAAERRALRLSPDLDELLVSNEPAARAAVWDSYRAAPLHQALRDDFAAKRVRHGGLESPYTLRAVGTKPAGGWPLFIALHGGGGAPKEVNDSQWRIMQGYYRDQTGQPSIPGYLYLALRAPNDAWNGFYADYVYPLVETLIRQLLVCEEVDPDKVFLMGYSHGGYGAFAIGPKVPYRFAAVHSSAAAPTDGETSPRTLRSTVFTFMIGEKDLAYGRLPRCQAFDKAIRELRGDRTDIYPVTMEFQAGFGHGGLPDRDKIRDMFPAVRDPAPRELSWEMTDGVVRDFFWLSIEKPAKGRRIEASCRENHLTLRTAGGARKLQVLLDRRLVDFARPLEVDLNGRRSVHTLRPSLSALLETLLGRGDIRLAFTAILELDAAERAF